MTEERKFKEAASFDEWFDLNEDLIHDMMRNDAYELMWETWFAGYGAGLDKMAHMATPLWPKNFADTNSVDKSQDQA